MQHSELMNVVAEKIDLVRYHINYHVVVQILARGLLLYDTIRY